MYIFVDMYSSRLTPCLLFMLLLTSFISVAQRTAYLQQQVDYQLAAELDPSRHLVSATGTVTYHNNSPVALDSIAFHLWANAYSDRESAYGKQMRRYGSTRFAFAPEEELGGYTSVSFTQEGKSNALRYESKEVVWLTLNKSLSPGDSVELDLVFSLRIPRTFSRMGREGQAYQLTQWYPKPALYDTSGWHTMPYLDFGEYFNDFGNYDVTLTVPINGSVAATGKLQNPAAIALRESRIATSQAAPTSLDSLSYGTGKVSYHYLAKNVTDFAWFVDPSFRIAVDSAILRQGTIPTYAYYTAVQDTLWIQGAALLARAVSFGDSLVGPYAHNTMTAVSAPLGVGGGMEYPSITVIGRVSDTASLDLVLAHEAYHNWFQGHLASNEREHAWMDEGLTSWLEQRYVERYYGEAGSLTEALPRFLAGGTTYSQNSVLAAFLGASKRNPAADTHSDSISQVHYGYAAYSLPALLFNMQEHVLADGEFVERVRKYYADWGGRHPAPSTLLEYLAQDDSGWLRQLVSEAELPDYRIASVEAQGDSLAIVVYNEGKIASPFPVAQLRADGTYSPEQWIAGFGESRSIKVKAYEDARRVSIDPLARTPETRRGDNYYRTTSGPFPKLEPMGVNLLTHAGRLGQTDLNLIPVVGFTRADQFMLGVGVHNYTADVGATRFYVLPEVSFRDASLNGFAGIRHSLYARNTWWRELEFSATGRQFHYNYNQTYDFNDRFHRGTLGATLLLKRSFSSTVDNRVRIRGHFVAQNYAVGRNAETRSFVEEQSSYSIVEADFTHRNEDPLRPLSIELKAQGGEGFARLSTTASLGLRYQEGDRFVRVRGFVGGFLKHDDPTAAAFLLPAGVSGFLNRQYDYTYEQHLITRSSSRESNQYFVRDGSLSLPFLLTVPFSDSWLASISLTADAPIGLPGIKFQGYLDAALYPDSRLGASGTVLPVTGGLRIATVGELVSVSFPLYNSSFVKEATVFTQSEPSYLDRMAFTLNLSLLRVDDLLRKFRG